MSLREKVVQHLIERREKLLAGGVNSIPSPFLRFSNDFIGLEQATYYIFTSFTKGGKSQLVSFLLYNALMFCYKNPESKASLKILYVALEETPERVLTRFISWLLYEHTNHKVHISPSDLRSSKNDSPLPEEVLSIINSKEVEDIIDYFEEHIVFIEEKNPTGIYKACRKYAEENGTVVTKPAKYRDDFGKIQETEAFDYYVPNNPNEYVIPVIDTINIVESERGYNKKQSIDKLSEYLAIYLRNRYGQSPIVIQQQNTDNESIESVRFNRTRPTTAGLGDSKYTAHDANIVLGIFSPYKFGLKDYLGYPIDKFKDHFRTLEVLVNRDGELGGIVPLFFDGAVCSWAELPKLDNTKEMNMVYAHLKDLEQSNIFMFIQNLLRPIKKLLNE